MTDLEEERVAMGGGDKKMAFSEISLGAASQKPIRSGTEMTQLSST